MKVTADLVLSVPDRRSLRKLSDVLAPDNEGLPKGLRLLATEAEGSLRYRVESGSPSATLSSVLALLRDVALFQEVWLLSQGQDAGGRKA